MSRDEVLAEARRARDAGATRYCMGAAWRSPKDRDLEAVADMVAGVKALGMETCVTLGMLSEPQAGAARRCRPRLLQPQSRHLRIVLRRDHHHAHLSGPARDPGPCARRRHQRLLRRHRGHGRSAPRPGGHDRDARRPAEPPRERAHQHAGASRGHAAQRPGRARSLGVRAHGGGGADHHAGLGGAALRRARADVGRDAGSSLPRRRQLGVRRAGAAHDAQSRSRTRPPSSSPASASRRCRLRPQPRRPQRSPWRAARPEVITVPSDARLARRGLRPRLAALHPDGERAAAAAGGRDQGHAYRPRRRSRADRRDRVVVDRLPRLQPPPHPRRRRRPARAHAPRDVRRPRQRARAQTGPPARRHAPRSARPGVLLGLRVGGGGDRAQDGAAVLAQPGSARAPPLRELPGRLSRRHLRRDVGVRSRGGHAQPVRRCAAGTARRATARGRGGHRRLRRLPRPPRGGRGGGHRRAAGPGRGRDALPRAGGAEHAAPRPATSTACC